MRRFPLLALAIAFSLFAGCAGSGQTTSTTTTTTSAAPATTTPETGGIEGQIVGDELTPIPGAEVALLRTNLTAKTDGTGKFSFSRLEPGSYDLIVQKLGYEAENRRVEVIAGEIAEAKVTLVAIAIVEPYTEPLIMDGYILLSNALLGAAEADAGVVAGCGKCSFRWNASADVVAVVMEVTYKPTLSVPPGMLLYTQVYQAESASGQPVVNEEWGDRNKEEVSNKGETPYYQYLGCGIMSFCYDQRFTEYVTLFHLAPPAEDFTALPSEG